MNITFLIGNGFDIACGMNTSYSAIKESYIENVKSEYSDILREHFLYEDWGDFEVGIYKNADKFADVNQLISCIEDFADYLPSYIKQEQEKYEKIISEDILDIIKKETGDMIKEFWERIPPEQTHFFKNLDEEPNFVNIISLNYSTLVNKIFGSTFTKKNVFNGKTSDYAEHYYLQDIINLHGVYDNPPSMVLGVDNENQFPQKIGKLNSFQKMSLIKQDFINEYDTSNERKAQQVLSDTNVLCIFGCSLSDSDLRIKHKIIEWFNETDDRHIIKFYRPDKSVLPNRGNHFIEKERVLIEYFASEIGISLNDENRKRIHIPLGYKLFNYEKVFEKAAEERKKFIEVKSD